MKGKWIQAQERLNILPSLRAEGQIKCEECYLQKLKHEEAWNNIYGHTNLLQLLTSVSFKCQWSLISSHKQMPTASNWRATTGPLILLHWTIKKFALYLDLTSGVTLGDLELISVHASIQVTMASANFVK